MKTRTSPLEAGASVVLYADKDPKEPRKIVKPGQHGFRVEGKVEVLWHYDEGKTWDLWGNRKNGATK